MMRKRILLSVLMVFGCYCLFAQNYNNIVNYNINGTPVYGTKIKTNIPFQNSYTMPYIKIQGFDYGKKAILDIDLVFYVFDNQFHIANASSSGSSAPKIWLSNESGKVTIFLDEKVYHRRFTVSAFAQGIQEKVSDFQGWTVVDQARGGSSQKQAEYLNIFAGKVGIGIITPKYELDVNGTIHSKEVRVDLVGWSDFVFDDDYQLPSLDEVETHIKENRHLPGIPSAKEVEEEGISLGDMNAKLLQKIEELTLYTIQQSKMLEEQMSIIQQQGKEIDNLKLQFSK